MVEASDPVTEMAPKSDLNGDDKEANATSESESVPSSKSQPGDDETKSGDEKNQKNSNTTVPTITSEESTSMEPSKKKKKKKKDTSITERKVKDADTSPSSSAKIDNENIKEKEITGKEDENNRKIDGGKEKKEKRDPSSGPVVSASKRTRPPYKFDPEKITLRFLFANRDGLTVTVECKPNDSVGEVKGQLLSVWPEDLESCSGGDQLRLICMGKGVLMPDTRTLEDCEVPVFKTHPTPVNVAVRPKPSAVESSKSGKDGGTRGGGSSGGGTSSQTTEETGQGCGCVIS